MNEQITIAITPSKILKVGSGDNSTIDGPRTITGWEEVDVTLRCEGFPPTFRLAASSGMPGGKDAALAHAGDGCTLRFGDDNVVTGYLTRLASQSSPGAHVVELIGAGTTQDLVSEIDWAESSAYLSPTTAAVTKIASYLGISVTVAPGADAVPAGTSADLANYPILLDYGVPAADYISQITRILGLLAYETADGKLMLSRAGTAVAASGAAYGVNVESFSMVNSMEDRFSDVIATRFRQEQFLNGGAGLPYIEFHVARDPAVPRKRVKHVFVENGPNSEQFAQRMADWEVARRAARGWQVHVTVDSWRDSAGLLWTPNTIVPIDLPGLSQAAGPFGLSEVTFRRNNSSGTTAELTLLPIAGFTPQPVQPTSANLIGVLGAPASAGGQQ